MAGQVVLLCDCLCLTDVLLRGVRVLAWPLMSHADLPLLQVDDVGRAMDLGREAAEFISRTFPPPVKLEFEKVWAMSC